MKMATNAKRTTQGLRDILFDEIAQLRSAEGDPSRALAVAKLAQQIIGTAKIEMQFVQTMNTMPQDGKRVQIGSMKLGS